MGVFVSFLSTFPQDGGVGGGGGGERTLGLSSENLRFIVIKSNKVMSVQKLTWQSNCLRRFITYYYTVTYY